jgi:hypothetical protein
VPVAKRRSDPSPGAVATGGWEFLKDSYVWYEGLIVHQYDAWWRGDVCAYRDGAEWAVATRGGLAVLHVRSLDDARSVAEIVAATLGDDLRLRDGEELKRRFPQWFRHWGVAVRRAGKYLDPGPYLDGRTTDKVTDGAKR